MRLRQVAMIATELNTVVDDLRAVFGWKIALDTDDEIALWGQGMVDEFKITNAVLPVGDTFLEVVSPSDPGTTAARYLARRGGDSGYMVLLQTGELDMARARAEHLGIREVWHSPLEGLRGVHFDPRDTRGSLLSLDQPDDPAEWPWAGPKWREAVRTEVTKQILAVEVQTKTPEVVAARWGELLARPVHRSPEGTHSVVLDQGRIRFVPADGEHGGGVCGIDLGCVEDHGILRRAEKRGLPVDETGRVLIGGVAFKPVVNSRQS